MSTVRPFPAGGYRFIGHQFQYFGGVAAEPGFRIERARFTRPAPLAAGFDAIESYLGRLAVGDPVLCLRAGLPRAIARPLGRGVRCAFCRGPCGWWVFP